MIMLDTDTCSYILRNKPGSVRVKFKEHEAEGISVSEIVLAELMYGAKRHQKKSSEILSLIDDFISRLQVLPWTGAQNYGVIRAEMQASAHVIGNMDMLIAAHTLHLDATLVSNNIKHFSRVPGLKVVNWV